MTGTHAKLVGGGVSSGASLADACPTRGGRIWRLDGTRVEDILSSSTAFLVSSAVCWVGCGICAYLYAQWMLGMA